MSEKSHCTNAIARDYGWQFEIPTRNKIGRGYVYSRDDGIMPFIEKLANKEMGVTKKDAWNPADIWLIKNETKVRKQWYFQYKRVCFQYIYQHLHPTVCINYCFFSIDSSKKHNKSCSQICK